MINIEILEDNTVDSIKINYLKNTLMVIGITTLILVMLGVIINSWYIWLLIGISIFIDLFI